MFGLSPKIKSLKQIHRYLFEDLYDNITAVRLFGVGANKLVESKEEVRQLSLFDDLDEVEKDHNITSLLESINKSIGSIVIKRGVDQTETKDLAKRYDKKWIPKIKEELNKIK